MNVKRQIAFYSEFFPFVTKADEGRAHRSAIRNIFLETLLVPRNIVYRLATSDDKPSVVAHFSTSASYSCNGGDSTVH